MQYKSKSVRVSDNIMKDIWNGVYDRESFLPALEELARKYRVSEVTLRRVLDRMEADGVLSRIPNCGMRISETLALPGKRVPAPEKGKCRIAAVIAGFPNVFSIELTRGIQEYAESHDCTFVLLQSSNGPDELYEEIGQLGMDDFDGFLLLDNDCNDCSCEKKLEHFHRPIVYLDSLPDGSKRSYVGPDHYMGGYLATACVLNRLGSGNCYFVSEDLDQLSVKLRRKGFESAMTDYGYQDRIPSQEYLFQPLKEAQYNPPEKSRYNAQKIHAFLKNIESPCGVVASNDYIASSVMQVAGLLKWEPGRDILVTGLDNLPLAAGLGLTSIRTDFADVGRVAVSQLHQMILGKSKSTLNKLLPVRLIERASTAGTKPK